MNYSHLKKNELIGIIREYESKKSDDINEQLLLKNTELKESQFLLEQSRDLYANLYDYSPVGLVTLDDKGIIKEINLTLAAMLGIERKNIPGKPLLVFVVKENIPAYLNYFRNILTATEANVILLPITGENNKIIYVQMYSNPVYDHGSSSILIQNTIIDVTAKKIAEDNLIESESRFRLIAVELEKALHEKVILLQEIHHRVKNNLQIINSLLTLQSTYVQDEHFNEIINTSKNRIKTMALIHENLYQENDLSDIQIDYYLDKLINYIFGSYTAPEQNIIFRNEIQKIKLNTDFAIYIGMIVNELVTNSLKYAFKNRSEGEIYISFRKFENGKHQLIISDNGIGLPADLDTSEDRTLGFLLVNGFVAQLNGTMTLDRKNGTTFK